MDGVPWALTPSISKPITDRKIPWTVPAELRWLGRIGVKVADPPSAKKLLFRINKQDSPQTVLNQTLEKIGKGKKNKDKMSKDEKLKKLEEEQRKHMKELQKESGKDKDMEYERHEFNNDTNDIDTKENKYKRENDVEDEEEEDDDYEDSYDLDDEENETG